MTHVSDEFLSALVDGHELAPADATHLRECDTCQERIEQFRRVSAAVGAPVGAPPVHLREAAVAIALDETTTAGATIRRLRDRRPDAKPAPARRMSALSAAAALVVALGVGGWLISQVGNDTTDENPSSSFAVDDSDNRSSANAAGSGLAEDATASALAAPIYDGGYIGSFSNVASVARRANRDLAQTPDAKAARSYPGAPPCAPAEGEAIEWHATLKFDGADAFARVVLRGSERTLQVLRTTDCERVASRAL